MPVINGGGSAEWGSTGVAAGSAPLAARSAIRPLTWSGDIDAGNCNTTAAPASSAAHPAGVTQRRTSSPKAKDRAAIALYLGEIATKPPAKRPAAPPRALTRLAALGTLSRSAGE